MTFNLSEVNREKCGTPKTEGLQIIPSLSFFHEDFSNCLYWEGFVLFQFSYFSVSLSLSLSLSLALSFISFHSFFFLLLLFFLKMFVSLRTSRQS